MKNDYIVKDGKVIILMEYKDQLWLTEISEEHLEKAEECTGYWTLMKQKGKKIYVQGFVRGGDGKLKNVTLHRHIMDYPKGRVIDHQSGDTLDNTIDNLRTCTQGENVRNRSKSTSKTGILGVGFNRKTGKWCARITVDGKSIHLGLFTDIESAKQARIDAERKYWGEFAPSFRHNVS
ncbi:HNH endonuclease [Ammoniphilus sp. CFH 90114]|uniref:HNH endonuclease n=1 Tax=Ammoniphilus sp. CFH 90114 TaxID=2493665 RepID=UPI0013E98710|nr:HNH endonuclease [Ammoniphilus sp. CFH 90114]